MIWGNGNQQIRAILQNGFVVSIYASLGAKNDFKGKEHNIDAIIRAGLPRLKNANISKATFDSIKNDMNEDEVIALVGEQPIRHVPGRGENERFQWYDDRGVIEVAFLNINAAAKCAQVVSQNNARRGSKPERLCEQQVPRAESRPVVRDYTGIPFPLGSRDLLLA